MKICTYNILEGGVGRIDPLAEVIRLSGAEVVVIQEAWDAAQFHKLADRLGMDRFLAENPRELNGAVGILTRWHLREAVNHAPLHSVLTRSVVTARVTHATKELDILGLHLHPREMPEDEQIRLTELQAVREIAGGLGAAHVVAGDFNSSHPAQVIDLAKLRPKVRDRAAQRGWTGKDFPRAVIGQMLAAGYVDAHGVGRSAEQFDTSLSTAYPGMRVDFVLALAALAPRIVSCEVFKPEMARFASDHYPVVAEIAL